MQLANEPMTEHITTTIQKLTHEKDAMEQLLQQKVNTLVQRRLTLVEKLQGTYQILNVLQTHVLDEELIKWKREQQLAGNGAAFNSNLDTIQEW